MWGVSAASLSEHQPWEGVRVGKWGQKIGCGGSRYFIYFLSPKSFKDIHYLQGGYFSRSVFVYFVCVCVCTYVALGVWYRV